MGAKSLDNDDPKVVYSQYSDIVPGIFMGEEESLQLEVEETTRATKAALDNIINARLNVAKPSCSYDCYKIIQFKNSGAKERFIRMQEMAFDPLEPPKFKHKKIPCLCSSSPEPVLHSPPPRPVTVKDENDWKISPCVSNWKNPKGYVIPLDKRVYVLADRRGVDDVKINDNFASFSEALYVAEEKARVAVAMRSKVRKEMCLKEKEEEEVKFRALAAKARAARLLHCEKIEEEKSKKKSKIARDRDRCVSEKVALGMVSVGASRGEAVVMYDQRLFNQEKGMSSGYNADDDQYNVYDKGATVSTLYHPKKIDIDSEMYGGSVDEFEKTRNTNRLKTNTVAKKSEDDLFGG